MRRPRLVVVLVLVLIPLYLLVLKRHYDSHNAPLPLRPPRPAPFGQSGRVQFGIMFDAGSTGTRIHVFKFRREADGLPELLEEYFKSISPGLSSFAENPPQCTEGLVQLLDFARSKIPLQFQGSTPVFLKATAGLRLLQEDQAERILNQVRSLFRESPFLSSDQNVSILDGAEEGVSAWLTVNYLLGALGGETDTVGMLDLGGASTQVTFSLGPKSDSSASDSQTLQLFNSRHTLYTHSYLGLGLMEARAAVLGLNSSDPGGAVSPCVSADSVVSWEHSHSVYSVRGQKTHSVYQSCSKRVSWVLESRVKPVDQQHSFYAFSFYYDRARDIRAIDGDKGGSVFVRDFSSAAQRVCEGEILTSDQNHFLCLDLVYISVLLQELGFSPDSELKLVRRIRGMETSWALGATFTHMNF